MKQLLYFAYGSNLLSKRLIARIGSANVYGNYTLNDYELVFNCGGFANIVPREGQIVEGTLYHINEEQLKELAFYEGFYKMNMFLVEDYIVVTFVALDRVLRQGERSQSKTKLDYINIILDGMLEKGLTTSYNKLVEIKDRSFKLSKGSKHKKI